MRCPRGLRSQRSTRGGAGLPPPPGSTTRPRQELADDSPAYPKRFPARRHGPRRIVGQGAAKAGPMTAKSPQWRAARRPPYPANGCGHHRFASFGAPSPYSRAGKPGEKFRRVSLPSLPLTGCPSGWRVVKSLPPPQRRKATPDLPARGRYNVSGCGSPFLGRVQPRGMRRWTIRNFSISR